MKNKNDNKRKVNKSHLKKSSSITGGSRSGTRKRVSSLQAEVSHRSKNKARSKEARQKNDANKYIKMHEKNKYSKKGNGGKIIMFIVTLLFFIYLVAIIFVNLTREKYDATIAEIGILSNSQTFTGIILRDEKVYKAKEDGNIKYFALEGDRVKSGMDIAGLIKDEDDIRKLEKRISEATEDLAIDTKLDKNITKSIKESFRTFTINNNYKNIQYTAKYNKQLFHEVNFIREKYLLESSEYANEYLRLKESYKRKIKFIKSDRSGIVSYNVDGFEDMNIKNIDYNELAGMSSELKSEYKKTVDKGDEVCKVIGGYLWYIVMEVDQVCEKELEKKKKSKNNYMTVLLGKQKQEMFAKIYKVEKVEGKTYLTLEFDRMLNDFLDSRVMPVQLVYRDYDGIKIPESAIVQKEFVKIPREFYVNENRHNGVFLEGNEVDKYGKTHLKMYNINMIKKVGDEIFIPADEKINIGTTVYLKDENKSFTITHSEKLDGVYVINKGFAMFKFIEKVYEEKGFIIVKSRIDYGIRIYDRIIADSKTVKENTIIK